VKNVSDTDTGLARREDELAARTAELERVEAKLREAQEALEATRELHRQTLSAESDAIITFDAQTLRLRDANEAALELYGYSRDQLLALKVSDLSAEPDGIAEDLQKTLREGPQKELRRYNRKRDGTVFPAQITSAAVTLAGRKMICQVIRDVTAARWAQEELVRIRAAVDAASDAVLIIDLNGKAVYMNSAFQRLSGHTLETLNKAGLESLCVDAPEAARLREAVSAGHNWTGELQMRSETGREFPASVRSNAVLDAGGNHIDTLLICSDITARKRTEEQLLYEETHDSLTGVLNRRYLMAQLTATVQAAKRYQRPLSLCLCDVDGFKQVNDTYGHVVGDLVLARFGKLLSNDTRGHDIAGRYGGDEFCIVLPQTSVEGAVRCAERLRKNLESEAVRAKDGTKLCITATFGIAEFDNEQMTEKDLLASADRALYEAKAAGRNRIVVHRLPDRKKGE